MKDIIKCLQIANLQSSLLNLQQQALLCCNFSEPEMDQLSAHTNNLLPIENIAFQSDKSVHEGSNATWDALPHLPVGAAGFQAQPWYGTGQGR